MTEYIIEWSGIGARIIELIGSVPACLIPKRIREERLREEIVRCRDCERFHTNTNGFDCPNLDSNGFCAWGVRKEGGDD